MLATILLGALGPTDQIEARIKKVTEGLAHVQITKDEQGEIVASYHAHQVMHKSSNKSRVKSQGSYWTTDPKPDGFVLTTYAFDHKATDPPRPFQAAKNRGDGFEFGDYQVNGSDKAVYLRMDWGLKTDPHLIARLRQAVTQGATPLPSR